MFNCLCIASRGKHTTDIIEQRANWTQQYVNKATITTSRSLNYRLRSSPENEMRMKYSDCLLFTWSVCVMRRRRRSRRCLEHHESPNTPITANRTQAAATVDGAYIENLKSAPAKPQSVTLSICVLSYSCCCCCCCCCCHSRKHDVSHTEKRGVLWLKPEMCRNDFYVPIPSRSHFHSHSRPWKVLDYIPIPIYSREVIPITSHSHSHSH